MKFITFENVRFTKIVTLFSLILVLSACGTTNMSQSDLSEVNNKTFENAQYDVFQATLQTLNQTGFTVRRSSSSDGTIEAEFYNVSSRGDEEKFFGYSSRMSQAVRAEFSLREIGDGSTRVELELIEVFPPPSSQYGSIRTTNSLRQMREPRFYQGLLEEIERRLNS